ncbi:hypothetical protein FACS189467_6610 [Bacteroidia bacterium]|nr:hypothetical protein FACS189467_6610 [Bacteroidia bacterium]
MVMKKYLVLMLLAGCAVAMSPACKKKDGDPKTWTCTCEGRNPTLASANGLTDAQKAAYEAQCTDDGASSLAKNVGGTPHCD